MQTLSYSVYFKAWYRDEGETGAFFCNKRHMISTIYELQLDSEAVTLVA
jgi:hypothetical protein